MKAFITGIDGFIGSHLANYLLEKNVEVFGSVLSMEHIENIEHIQNRIKLFECDVCDKKRVKKIIEEINPDHIYHLAAQSLPTVSWEKPKYTFDVNAGGTINVFESVRELKINPKILVACSSAEYGFVKEDEVPVKETHELKPLHPYGVSKVAQDLLAYQYFKNFNINTIRVRIFNTTGPRKTNDALSDFTRQIAEIEKRKKTTVMYVGNLEPRRDFTDVRDMVNAFWMLMEKGRMGSVYNISSGKAYKIKDILNILLGLSETKVIVKVDPKKLRPTDEPIIMGDNTKIKNDCGWKPEIPLEKTMEDTLNYWRNFYTV